MDGISLPMSNQAAIHAPAGGFNRQMDRHNVCHAANAHLENTMPATLPPLNALPVHRIGTSLQTLIIHLVYYVTVVLLESIA